MHSNETGLTQASMINGLPLCQMSDGLRPAISTKGHQAHHPNKAMLTLQDASALKSMDRQDYVGQVQ